RVARPEGAREKGGVMAYAAERLAEWTTGLSFDDIPEDVVERAKLHLLDAVGCGLAAVALGDLTAAREAALELGGKPEASVLGSQERLSAGMAAFANGAIMHALDFDDTHEHGLCHSSTVVVPVVLAVGEAVDADGKEALAAAVAAYETSARIGIAGAGRLHRHGFHPTSVA